jgi:hypothetical protein
MKCFQQLFIFSLCACLSLGPVSVYAETGTETPHVKPENRVNAKTTAHGYNPGAFCVNGAETMMAKLEDANKDKFEKITIYKQQIEDLQNYDNLINDVTAIKNRYLKSVVSAAANDANSNADVTKKLDDAKSIIRHGLMLNALSTITEKNENTKPANSQNTQKTVPNSNKNQSPTNQNIESKYFKIPSGLSSIFKMEKDPVLSEMQKLQQSANNFQEASSKLPENDQKTLNEEVKKIVNDIPKDISPETLLNTLNKDSPLMTQLLTNQISREDLILCLSDKDTKPSLDACERILKDPEDRKKLIQAIGSESAKFTKTLNKDAVAIKVAQEKNQTDLEKTLQNFDLNKSQTTLEETKKTITLTQGQLNQYSQNYTLINMMLKDNLRSSQTNVDELNGKTVEEKAKDSMLLKETDLNGMENFFYEKPTPDKLRALNIDLNTKEGAFAAQNLQQKAIDNAKQDALIFNRDCDFSNQIKSENEIAKISTCKGLVEKLVPQINAMKNSHYDQVVELNTKIQKLAGDNDFAATENLKKYVAEKYLCSCEKDKSKVRTSYDESLVMSANSCTTQFMTLSKIEGLSNSTSMIANALYAHEIKMPMDKESCNFGPEQIKTFTDTCNNNANISNEFQDICSSITSEYTAKVKNQEYVSKQNAKWDKYHKDNYVEYDRNSPTGYTAVKKKSNLRVLGEGVLPILPNALPIWFGNYQMKNNINSLTDQAIMQKQYLYNIDIYNQSPWMYNYNYFSYGNPFNTNTTFGTTSTSSSSGFNFGL